MSDTTDDKLVLEARAGDTDSMEELLNRYRNYVKAKARAFFLAGSEPEDLVQEGMIGLYKAIRDYREDRNCSFKSFAKLCIDRQIVTAIKTANREKHQPLNNYISLYRPEEPGGEEIAVDLIDTTLSANPEQAVMNREIRDTVYDKMNTALSKTERQVLLAYLQGMSYAGIAAQIGGTPKSVDNALQRIRKKLFKLVLADGR